MAESDPALVHSNDGDDAATANVRVASLENRLGTADRLANLEARVSANEQALHERWRSIRDHADQKQGIIETRFDAMDKATSLLSDTVNRVPTETQREVGNLQAVVAEQFKSVDKQFTERDTRSEREARDNKLAVDAAFAAQEKQAVAQNDANTTAINKSEAATTETINKLAELFESRTEGLREQLADLKLQVRSMESSGRALGHRSEALSTSVIGWAAVAAIVLSMVVGLLVRFA